MMKIRSMVEDDRRIVKEMMRTFYASPAVLSNGSETIFDADIDACVGSSPYLEGFVLEEEGAVIGYGMIARSFSTEFGKPCVWIEDLYLREEFRGAGRGSRFFDYIAEQNPECLLRLEVEPDNVRARKVYQKNGFDELPYVEMKKNEG